MEPEASYDAFGFPCGELSKRHLRRMNIRAFTSRNHWESKYPDVASASRAINNSRGTNSEIYQLILNHGILPEYRPELYWLLTERHRKDPIGDASTKYLELCKSAANLPAEAARQIELDIPRTFCEQRDFKESNSDAHDGSRSTIMSKSGSDETKLSVQSPGEGSISDALRRMLRAFCVLHPEDGYLQSMNFVASFMLLIFGRADEARAFWCFEYMCAHALKGYYTSDMAALKRDCDIFKATLETRNSILAKHFQEIGDIDLSTLFLPRWLLCGFLNCFTAEIVARVWDCMIFRGNEGSILLLEVALAVVEMCHGDLMAAANFGDVVEALKDLGEYVSDSAELMLLTLTPDCCLGVRTATTEKWRGGEAGMSTYASPSFAGHKRRRSGVRSPHGVLSPIGSPEMRTPPNRVRQRLSLLATHKSPGRTPPVAIEAGLERLDAFLAPFPMLSPGKLGGVKSPALQSSTLKSPLSLQTTGILHENTPSAPAVAPLQVLPSAAAIAAELNPSISAGLLSARKRREATRLTASKSISRPGTNQIMPVTPSALPYATMYNEYDQDAVDPDHSGEGVSEMMMLAPRSAKRPRKQLATDENAPPADSIPGKGAGMSLQMQLLSPKRSRVQ